MKRQAMKHVLETHVDCQNSPCSICDGGLAYCTVCGGFEGTLTTDCCGRRLTEDDEHRIFDLGILDYRDGAWLDMPNFPRASRRVREEAKP